MAQPAPGGGTSGGPDAVPEKPAPGGTQHTTILTIPIRPRAKGRPRMSKNGHVFTPSATKEYEKAIREAWQKDCSHAPVLTGPVILGMSFYFKRPKSHYTSTGELKETAPKRMLGVPDLDNLEKAVMDALNGVAFVDDKQVVRKTAGKGYGSTDKVIVTVIGHMSNKPTGVQF